MSSVAVFGWANLMDPSSFFELLMEKNLASCRTSWEGRRLAIPCCQRFCRLNSGKKDVGRDVATGLYALF